MNRKALVHVLVLYLAGVIAGMQFAKFSVTIDLLQQNLGVSVVYSSWILSALGSMGMLFGATIGVIVGRFSSLKLLAGGLWFAGMISLGQPLLTQPSLLMTSRILESFTQLIIVSAAPTAMLMCTEKKDQPMVMALWGSFFSVAFLLVQGVAPWLLQRWGWHSIFYTHGVVTLLVAMGVTFFAIHSSTQGAGRGEQATHFTFRVFVKQHKEVYGRRGSALPSLLFMTYTMVYLAFLTYIPMLFQQRYGIGSSLERLLIVGMPILSLVGTAISSVVLRSKIIPPLGVLIAAYVGMIISVIFLMTPLPTTMFLVVAFCFVTGSGVLQSTIFGIIPYLSDNPTTHAYANGGIAQMGNIGTTLGSPIFAMLLVYGWSVALLLPIICSLLGVIIICTFSKRVKLDDSQRTS